MSIFSVLKTSLLLYSYLVGLSVLFYPFSIKKTLKNDNRTTTEKRTNNGLRNTKKHSGKLKNGNLKSRELEMKLPIGLGLKLGFVPIFHFPAARARSVLVITVVIKGK